MLHGLVVFFESAQKLTGDNNVQDDIDWNKVPPKNGLTLELCAGILDEKLSLEELAQKEVLEECGYNIPLSNFQKVINYA